VTRELTDPERQYLAYKKTKEYEYAAGYLPVGALERMDEQDLRAEVREVISEYLPEADRRELRAELNEAKRELGLFEDPLDSETTYDGPYFYVDK
jgi:hypothetical protein